MYMCTHVCVRVRVCVCVCVCVCNITVPRQAQASVFRWWWLPCIVSYASNRLEKSSAHDSRVGVNSTTTALRCMLKPRANRSLKCRAPIVYPTPLPRQTN